MAAALPMEIIGDILSRLPVTPLLRFKSVSKSWYSFINTLDFIKLHLHQTLISNSHRHLIISYSSLSSAILDAPNSHFSELHHPLKNSTLNNENPNNFSPQIGVEVLGSCNGVLCISDSTKKNDVFLYNPSTKSHRKLPFSHIPYSYTDDCLVFGFGYDSFSDDYKVLRIIQCCGSCDDDDGKEYSEAKVYSLRSNSWKWVNDDLPFYVLYKDCNGVLVNEGLHYIVTKKELDINHKFICKFDLRSENYSLVDRPEYEDDDESSSVTLFLGGLNGCLCLLVNYFKYMGSADLWIMKEYGKKESWVRLFSVLQPETIVSFLQIRPVAYSKNGDKVLIEQDNCKLRWFDLRTKMAKGLKVCGLPDEDFDTGIFVESLVSLSEDKPQLGGRTISRRNKNKNDLDNFLSVGFKLKL